MKDENINILGTTYKVMYRKSSEDECLEDKAFAYCDPYAKIIVVSTDPEKYINSRKDQDYSKKVDIAIRDSLRHEIIHAFIYESGMTASGIEQEEYIDWIALMIPKMLSVMETAGAMESNKAIPVMEEPSENTYLKTLFPDAMKNSVHSAYDSTPMYNYYSDVK